MFNGLFEKYVIKNAIFDLSSPSYTFPPFCIDLPKVIKMKYIFLYHGETDPYFGQQWNSRFCWSTHLDKRNSISIFLKLLEVTDKYLLSLPKEYR